MLRPVIKCSQHIAAASSTTPIKILINSFLLAVNILSFFSLSALAAVCVCCGLTVTPSSMLSQVCCSIVCSSFCGLSLVTTSFLVAKVKVSLSTSGRVFILSSIFAAQWAQFRFSRVNAYVTVLLVSCGTTVTPSSMLSQVC